MCVLCDSNLCERSFCAARQFLHYIPAHMAPESLEMLRTIPPLLQQRPMELLYKTRLKRRLLLPGDAENNDDDDDDDDF